VPRTPLPAQPPSPPRSGNAEATTSSARCASEPQSPSKRPREEGETSRALVLVGEKEGDAPRAAVASPKRPRAPPAQVGVGLPCQWCSIALTAEPRRCMPECARRIRRSCRAQVGVGLPCQWCGIALAAGGRRCRGEAPKKVDASGRLVVPLLAVCCAPSAEALAVAGWNHDRPP
jgi:hypothetical protein